MSCLGAILNCPRNGLKTKPSNKVSAASKKCGMQGQPIFSGNEQVQFELNPKEGGGGSKIN